MPGSKECHSNDVINNYVKDLQIDAWIVYKRVNFQEHEKDPIDTAAENVGIFLLDKSRATI